MAARASLVPVADVWAGPRGDAVSPGSLLLRLMGFGWGCAGARNRPSPEENRGCLGGAARARGLARILAVARDRHRWGFGGAWPARNPLVIVVGVTAFRLVGFGRASPPRGLAGIFVVAVGGVRVDLRVRADSTWLLPLVYTLLD